MMGEYLGLEGKDLDEYVAKVQQGKIANQDFVDTLIAAGTQEGGKIRMVALESLDTWEAFFSRISTAASKFMWKGILEPMNDLVKIATNGKFESLNLFLDDLVYNRIDKMGQKVKDWINSHPEEITNFFKDLSKINFGSFLKGFVNGTGYILKLLQGVAKLADGKGLGKLGWLFGAGGFIGRGSTIVGGLLKGTRHIWAGLLTPLFRAGSGKGGIFGKIASIFGKKKDIETAGDAAKSIPTVADTFKGAFSALQGLIQAAGAVLIVSGTGFVAFKAAKSILTDLKEMTDLVNGGGWDNVGYVASGVIAGIGAFTEIFNAIGTALGPQGLLAVAIAGAASFIVAGSFAADMWAIKQGVIQIKDTITELDNVATEITNFQGIGTLGEGIKKRFTDTVSAINEIKGIFDGKNGSPMDRGVVQAGLPTFGIGKVSAITNIVNAVKGLQKFVNSINTLSSVTINEGAVGKVEEISKAINSITKAMPNAMKNANSSYGNMADNIKSLNKALKSMSTMASRINGLAGMDVNTSGFSAFVESIRTALEDFKSLSGELMLDIEVKLSPLFGSSVNAVKTNIKNAKRDIERLKTPVSFTIPVSVTFSVSTNALSAIAKIKQDRQLVSNAKAGIMTPVFQAKGGMIYRAGGGGVPWKRRGTDTVPAMLTPGEYVHNKRAVNTFGIDFMRKVNNLDVKGAMNELMHRAGHMANVNRGSVVNNTYNNNQKVVINNNGNSGAGYTFKRASRFVGAL